MVVRSPVRFLPAANRAPETIQYQTKYGFVFKVSMYSAASESAGGIASGSSVTKVMARPIVTSMHGHT